MKLIKVSTGETISNNIYFASSFLDATFGLILKRNTDLYFKTHFGIHTFLMKDEIDVVIAASDFKVVKIKKGLRPNRIFTWNLIYPNVFELKKGTIEKSSLKVGDKLKLLP